MSWALVLGSAAVLGAIRWIPLQGVRRLLAVAVRLAAIALLLWAIRGAAIVREQEQPRHIAYVVDQSASIDPEQRAWMARRLASLEAIRPPGVTRSVIAFGSQPTMTVPPGREPLTDPDAVERALREARIEPQATNVETALLSGLATLPKQQHQRIVLLTDGRETAGNAERLLAQVRHLGLEIYPVVPPTTAVQGLLWEQLTVPGIAQRGSSIPIRLVVTNGTGRPQPVEVAASLQGVTLARRRVLVPPGWHIITLGAPALKLGTMALDVSAKFPGEAAIQQRKAFVEVEGPPQVLLVLDRPTELPLLATALKRREIDIAVSTPAELPRDARALQDYDLVLLFQVPKSSLTAEQVDALRAYLEDGGGMVMVGLGGSLRDEVTREAPLDALLPVKFEPKGVKEAKRRICMIMLIDRSASMIGPRIAATKRAAVELVRQLAPEDLVGILAFDTMPYIVADVQPARQVTAQLIEKLVHLKATGGTNIFPALKAAQQRLQTTGASVKHIVLLSDGITPPEISSYKRLFAELSAEDTTISTIGVGGIMINADMLEWMATSTGGTFYQLNGLDELPSLVARDTQRAIGRLPFTEGSFQPVTAAEAQWLTEVTDWPTLNGYLTTTAKPTARVELNVRQGDTEEPLLAEWMVGNGRVAVFTSDADTRWSADWIRWPRFDAVWAEIVRQTMRPRATEQSFIWLDEQAARPQIVVEGDLASPSAELWPSDDAAPIPLAMVQHSAVRWEAAVDHVPDGWYQVVVRATPAGSSPSARPVIAARRWVRIGRPAPEPERSHLPPDEALLRRLAEATGGVYDAADAAFLPPTERVERRLSMRPGLLALAILVLLVDIALRGRTML